MRSSQEGDSRVEEVEAELEATRRELTALQNATAHGGGGAQSRAAAAEKEARELERRLARERLVREEEVGKWRMRAEHAESRAAGGGEEAGAGSSPGAGTGGGAGGGGGVEQVRALR